MTTNQQQQLLNRAISNLCTAQTVTGDEHKNLLEDAIEALQMLREYTYQALQCEE